MKSIDTVKPPHQGAVAKWPKIFAEITRRLDEGAEGVLLECGVDIGAPTPGKAIATFRVARHRYSRDLGLRAYQVEEGVMVYRPKSADA